MDYIEHLSWTPPKTSILLPLIAGEGMKLWSKTWIIYMKYITIIIIIYTEEVTILWLNIAPSCHTFCVVFDRGSLSLRGLKRHSLLQLTLYWPIFCTLFIFVLQFTWYLACYCGHICRYWCGFYSIIHICMGSKEWEISIDITFGLIGHAKVFWIFTNFFIFNPKYSNILYPSQRIILIIA